MPYRSVLDISDHPITEWLRKERQGVQARIYDPSKQIVLGYKYPDWMSRAIEATLKGEKSCQKNTSE